VTFYDGARVLAVAPIVEGSAVHQTVMLARAGQGLAHYPEMEARHRGNSSRVPRAETAVAGPAGFGPSQSFHGTGGVSIGARSEI